MKQQSHNRKLRLELQHAINLTFYTIKILYTNTNLKKITYSGMQEKVTQRVGWVENPTVPQAVWNVGFGNPTHLL